MPVIGLRDLHVAKLNEDGTYDAPKKLSPLVNANITPNYQIVTQYGDDRAVAVAEAMGNITVEIGLTDLTTEDYEYIFGKTKNADGVLEDTVDDVIPYVALGFRLPKEDGGFRYYWYYKGKFQPPSSAHQTKGENIQFEQPTISGTFMARDDGKWRAWVDSKDEGVSPTVISGWFANVYEPTPQV